MLKFKAYNIIKIRHPDYADEKIKKKAAELIEKEKTKENIDKLLIVEQIIQKYSYKKREDLNELDIKELREMNISNEEIQAKLNKEALNAKLKIMNEQYLQKKRTYIDNIDFISGYKKYIFFGHGWNTDKVFSIKNKTNIYIVLLESPVTCADSMKYNFTEKLKNSTSSLEYINYVNKIAKKLRNEFCMYNSESEFHIVPDMLITTYKNKNELVALIDIDAKKIISNSSIMLLSELVETLGNNFFLQIYACRSQLDAYQIENIQIIEVKEYINNKQLKILNEDDIIQTPKCSPFI